MDYIKGTYTNEIYINEANNYIVGLMRIKESSIHEYVNKVITFTGTFNELKIKNNYIFNGEFTNHAKYGLQFKVENYELALPTDKEELIEFLSSDIFPIGEKTAEKIADTLGPRAIDIINENPNSLLMIPRLNQKKIDKIAEVLKEYKSTSKIVLELSKMGFNTKTAISILKKYNNKALDIIENNIYDALLDIDIPFKELDTIAKNNGYLLNDERRLLSLTIYLMNTITFNKGDTYSYFTELYEEIIKETDNLSKEEFEYILIKLDKLNKIKIDGDKYYLIDLYDAEKFITERVCILNNMARRSLPKLDKKIDLLEEENKLKYDISQREAITKAINNNLTIITGGPGSGKTTIVKCITKLLLDIYKIEEEKIALLSPTGRAARKLSETTNLPAMTIHRYLKWDKENNLFQIDETCPNQQEYIIVDEASMIDTRLLSSLFKGTTYKAKFIFVGDYYQLPSVSQGQVLKDLIDSECLDVIKLNCLYRQTEGSYIINLAHEIKDKDLSETFLEKKDDYNFIKCDPSNILEVTKEVVEKAISAGFDKNSIQVLAPLYKTNIGIDNLNKMLKEILNPESKDKFEYLSGDITYREGDKVLQLVNDYDNNISNGDIGYIKSIKNNSKTKKMEITIDYDDTSVVYNPKDLINITHGYAISVHKSQGGEFKTVIIPFAPSYKRMLYNKLIYTAVTRAKEKLILIGDPSSFIYGVKNDYIEQRKTTIKDMVKNKYN